MASGVRPFLLASLVLAGCATSPQVKEAKYLKAGHARMDKKDYPRAILEFKNAAQAMPQDAEPNYQMGLAYLETGDNASAVAAFRRTLDLKPEHLGAQLKMAELMTASGQKDLVAQAAESLENILAASPDDPEANATLALAEWQLGKPDDAAERLAQTLQKLPAHLQSSVALAKVKVSQKDISGAIEVLEKAVASDSQSAAAALALGQLYAVAAQPEKAESEIRRSLQLDPTSPSALMSLASLQASSKRLDEADQTYQKLAALPDKKFRPIHALFLFQIGKREAALAELKQILKSDPADRASRSRVVAAYVDMGNLTEAQNLLTAALKSNSNDADALFQQSVLYVKSGKLTEAKADLEQVLQLHPDWAQAHFALSEVYRLRGLTMNQRQELSEAVRLQPTLVVARLALAKNLNDSNGAKSALDLLNHTPEAQKGLLPVIVERNWALLGSGDSKELRANLDQMLKANRYPEVVFQDATLRFNSRDYAGAASAVEEVLSHDPRDARAARLLASIYAAQDPPERVVAKLSEAAVAHPKSLPLQQLMGEWEAHTGNLTGARKVFESIQAADPAYTPVELDLAGVDDSERKFDAARQRMAVIVRADPGNVKALMMLASIEGDAGNRNESIKNYRAILSIDSTNLFALNNLAYLLLSENPSEALKYAQQAGEIAPDSPNVEDTLGWVYYRMGVYSNAVSYLKMAVAKESTPARQYHLAMSYIKSGNNELGQSLLRDALHKDPSLAKAEHDW